MIAKELKELLANCPDDAIVYVEADHGQLPEQAYSLYVCDFQDELPYYGDDLVFEESTKGDITAILISA